MNRLATSTLLPALALLTISVPVYADDHDPATNAPVIEPAIIRMMEAAADRDDGSLDTVVDIAAEANPDSAEAIHAYANALREPGDLVIEDVPDPVAAAAKSGTTAPSDAQPADDTPEREPRFFSFSGWDGEVDLSASRYTGNTSRTSVGLGGKASKELGRWLHGFRGLVEFEESSGETIAQRFLAGYDVNYTFNHRAYVFGGLLYEDDRFGGYDYRFSETTGLGYQILDNDRFKWSVEGGPGARHTKIEGEGLDTEFVGVMASKFAWHVNERTELTHDYSMFVGSDRTSIDTTAAIRMQINGDLSARLSYNYRFDSGVPPTTSKTDTVTRAALVYSF